MSPTIETIKPKLGRPLKMNTGIPSGVSSSANITAPATVPMGKILNATVSSKDTEDYNDLGDMDGSNSLKTEVSMSLQCVGV